MLQQVIFKLNSCELATFIVILIFIIVIINITGSWCKQSLLSCVCRNATGTVTELWQNCGFLCDTFFCVQWWTVNIYHTKHHEPEPSLAWEKLSKFQLLKTAAIFMLTEWNQNRVTTVINSRKPISVPRWHYGSILTVCYTAILTLW